MGDLVCDGTEFSCPFCTSKLKLKVLSSSATGGGKKIANMSNSLFPPPGGNCTVVPSAPVPCTPAATPIDPGQKNVQVDQAPALGAACKFQCAKGGLLTVSSPGQSKAKHDEATGGVGAILASSYGSIFHPVPRPANDVSKKNEEDKENVAPPPPKKEPKPGTTFVGSKRNQYQNVPYQPVRNAPQTINKRHYSGHAIDQMQNRGIKPSVVEHTIQNGNKEEILRKGKITIRYYDPKNNITVVSNDNDKVVTVGYGLMTRGTKPKL